mmetsp:Transcript_13331/g.38323  ORF Transcript_13331/g.38323 Transcript_13331/m.38323 type:complete len:235 (-) Transcript_13331:112-816(-)
MAPQDEVVLMARIAESAERYEDMADFMKERVDMGGPLSREERDMFSAAFKHAMSSRRNATRIAKAICTAKEQEGNQAQADLATNYRSKMEAQLRGVCEKALSTLEQSLIPGVGGDAEAKVFYLKMRGDYYRYLSENLEPSARAEQASKAEQAYSTGIAEAEAALSDVHPTRLGLILNFSVFKHEVLGDTQGAIGMAHAVLAAATPDKLNALDKDALQDSEMTLSLLQDNLHLWG